MERPGTQTFDNFPSGTAYITHVQERLRQLGGGSLQSDMPLEDALARLAPLDPAAEKDFRQAHGKYPELAPWWVGIRQIRERDPEHLHDAALVGLAVAAGLPGVTSQLLREGFANNEIDRTRAFERAALSMRGYAANSKIHPAQLQALEVLCAAGINTSHIIDRKIPPLLQNQRLAPLLIANGVDPLRQGSFLTRDPVPLISILADPDWALADNPRRLLFQHFLDAGLDPWQPDLHGMMPVEHLFRSVRGLQMLDLLVNHPGRPAAVPLLKQKREKLARNAHNLKEGEKFLRAVDALILDSATHAAEPSAGPKRRM